jgi:pilus assembly protein CpaE
MKSTTAAMISSDPNLRDLLVQVLAEAGRSMSLGVEIAEPFTQITDRQLRELREARPEVIFIDLEPDPRVGIKLAQFLASGEPNRLFVAVGPPLSPELLLEAMRSGIGEYLPKPLTPDAVRSALRRMQYRLGLPTNGSEGAKGKVLAFFSAKGGSGCTTIASNLAIHLHQLTGKRTLLVDLDLELGEIALFLGVQPRFNLTDLVRNFHRMDADLLASYIERHESGVHLLSAPYHPERVENVTGEQFRTILQFLARHYDYVLVDTPRTFSPAALVAFEEAEQLHLVGHLDLPSLRNIKRCLPLLDRITGGNMGERVRLLVNRYNSSATEISTAELEKALGLTVFWKLSNDYEAVMRSINNGHPIALDSRASAIGRDLRALGAEIAGLGGVTVPTGRRQVGGLFRIFAGTREGTS